MASGTKQAMGRPKKRLKPEDKPAGVTIRGSAAWRDWINELAEFRRLAAPDLIDHALVEYAEKHGFEKPAPKR